MAAGVVPRGGTERGGRRRRLEVGWRRMGKRSGWRGSERTARKSEATSIQQVDLYVYIRKFQTLLPRPLLIEWCFSLVLYARILSVYVICGTTTTRRFVFYVSPLLPPSNRHTRTATQLNRASVSVQMLSFYRYLSVMRGMGRKKTGILRKKGKSTTRLYCYVRRQQRV